MWTSVPLDLHYTSPIDTSALWDYWHDRTIAGVEEWQEHTYRRAVHLPGGPGIISVHRRGESLNGHALSGEALLADVADTLAARTMLHRTIDASMSPNAVCEGLGEHPWLGELVRTRPGLRAPQHPGWFEVTLRAVLAQQVSLRAARTHTARLVRAVGTPLAQPVGSITHTFPTAGQVLDLAQDQGEVLAMPAGRRRAVLGVARAAAEGLDLEDGRSPEAAGRTLCALPGIGPWTAQYVRMRALGDPDGFCGSDLVLRRTAERLSGRPLEATGAQFRPWRTYAAHHLWRAARLHLAGTGDAQPRRAGTTLTTEDPW